MSKVFVSYKRDDKDKVFPLVQKMELELGFKFWVDLTGIESDEQFSNVIVNAINQCEVFLFMYSKAHENINPKDDWTVREIIFAAKKKKRIVFLDIDDYELPDWFSFRFPDQQVIKTNDSRAMGKLVDDMRNWLRLPLPNNQGKSIDTKDTNKRRPNRQSEKSEEINSHPQAIDLGLPSGTKWASCNVGAAKPEEFGGYYSWGETKDKKKIDLRPYIFYGRTLWKASRNIGIDISGTKYDVAHLEWGDNWRMPTFEQFKELLSNCHHKWISLNSVKGCEFTSKSNGNSIFLPAVGAHWGVLLGAGSYGYYWSSTLYPLNSGKAYNLYVGSDGTKWGYNLRFSSFAVRPILCN